MARVPMAVHANVLVLHSAGKSYAEIASMLKLAKAPSSTSYRKQMLVGQLVTAVTMTCTHDLRPSVRVSSCDTVRRSTSPWGRGRGREQGGRGEALHLAF